MHSVPSKPIAPLKMSELPAHPWQALSLDFLSPGLPTGEYLLVLVDEYSRYPVVETVRTTSYEATHPVLKKIFATFGFPETIKTDNGPPFSGHEFQTYLESCGIKHRKITPLWPRANAQAENFNKPIMKAVRAAFIEKRKWDVNEFLQAYRSTPHVSTKFSPHYLMFGRHPNTYLPMVQQENHPEDEAVCRNDCIAKKTQKTNADSIHARETRITRGDTVLVKNQSRGKIHTRFAPDPLIVLETKGSMVTAACGNGRTITRDGSHFRKIPSNDLPTHDLPDLDVEDPVAHDMPEPMPGVMPENAADQPGAMPGHPDPDPEAKYSRRGRRIKPRRILDL